MSKCMLFYKSKLYTKRTDPAATVKNINHVKYIATRPGAWKDNENGNALFGSFDQQYQNSLSIEEGVRQVEKATDSYKTIYRDIISFTEGQARALGLNTLEDWKRYVKEQVINIARGKGIKLENLEWEAAIHQKKGQPHAHIVMWDRSSAVQPNTLSPKLNSRIREILIQKTYKAEFKEFFARQNELKNNIRSESKELFAKFEEYLSAQELSSEDIRQIGNRIKIDVSGLSNTDILQSANVSEIVSGYLKLRLKILEEHPDGRLNFGGLSKPLKNEMKEYIKLILNSSDKLKTLFDEFVKAHLAVYEFYSWKNLEYPKNKVSLDAVKYISNALLQSMKNYRFTDDDELRSAFARLKQGRLALDGRNRIYVSEQDIKENTEAVADCIFAIFCQFAALIRQRNTRNAEYSDMLRSGELSREALRELIEQLKDRGLEI